MQADIATLGIRVDARQVRDADSALDQFGRTGRTAEQRAQALEAAMTKMAQAAAAVAAALSVQKIIQYADEWASLQGRLSLVTDSTAQLTQVTGQLFAMAQRTRAPLSATVDLYGRIARSTADLNKTDAERLRVTETINKALTISGTKAEEAAGPLLQLGQAFGSGALRGDEFNSVLEGMPRLAQAIAEGMGKTTGQLRALAADGKLTSEVLFKSITNQSAAIDAEFAKLPVTIGQAVTTIENSLLRTIGVFDQQNKLSRELAGTLVTLGDNMGVIVGIVATLTAMKLASWFDGAVTAIRAKIAASTAERAATLAAAQAEATAAAVAVENTAVRLAEARAAQLAAAGNVQIALTTNAVIPLQNAQAAATARLDVAMLGLAAAQRAAALSSRVLGAALSITGGPIGLLVTVLGLAATAWSWYSSKQEEANAKAAADTAKSTNEIIDGLDKQIEKIRLRNLLAKADAGGKALADQGGDAADRAAELLEKINKLKAQGVSLSAADQVELITLQGLYDQLIGKAQELAKARGDAAAKTDAEKLSDWYNKNTQYLDKAGKIAAAIANARKELGTAFNADVEKKIRDSFSAQDVKNVTNAYDDLVKSLRAKVAEQRIEVAAGRDATDGQKEAIKFDLQQADAKKRVSAARAAVVLGLIAEVKANERAVQQAQMQKDIDKQIADGLLARREAADGLAVEYAAYGKVSDARDLDMVRVRAESDLRKKLAALVETNTAGYAAMAEQLREDTEARIANERSILSQSKALAYADQLRQQNEQFRVDYITDPKAKAAAQLDIDKKMWEQRIALAEDGSYARMRLETEYTTWLQNQSIKPQLDAQIALWSSIEDAARDAFVGMLSNGKSTFERLRDSLKNTLYALLYEMTVKKWIISVQVDVVGGVASQALGSSASGSLLSALVSKGASALGLTSGASGIMSSAGSAGSVGTLGANGALEFGSTAAGAGSTTASLLSAANNAYSSLTGAITALPDTIAAGVQSALSAAGYTPLASQGLATAGGQALTSGAALAGQLGGAAAGGLAGHTLNSAISGGYKVSGGLNTVSSIAGTVASYFNPLFGAAIGAVTGVINRAFGRKAPEIQSQGLRGSYTAGMGVDGETYQNIIEKGGWFRSDKKYTNKQDLDTAAQSQLAQSFLAITDASSTLAKSLGLGSDALKGYSKTFDITLSGDAAKNQEAIAKFFDGVADEVANKLVPNLASFSQTGETASATLQRLAGEFEATTQAVQLLGKTAEQAFGDVGFASAAARERLVQLAGGTSNLTSLASAFAQTFLSDTERLVPVQKALNDAFKELGVTSIPKTNDEFKALVQGLDVTNEAQAKQLVALLQLAPAFAQVTEASAAAAQAAKDEAAAKAEALASQLDAAMSAIERAVDAQKKALQATYEQNIAKIGAAIDRTKSSVEKLTDLSKTLHDAVSAAAGDAGSLSRADGQAQIQAALAIARAGGPLPTADSLKDAIAAVSRDNMDDYSTFEDYQRDRLSSAIALNDLAKITDGQLDTATLQLNALQGLRDQQEAIYNAEVARLDSIVATAQMQVDAVKGVDISVQTVQAAVMGLQSILGSVSTQMSAAATIAQQYQSSLGRAPDAEGYAFWQNAAATGTSLTSIGQQIATSTEAADKLEALYQKVLGRSSDASGKAFWQDALKNGVSLSQIEREFYESPEYLSKVTGKPSTMSSASGGTNASVSAADVTKLIGDALAEPLKKIASYTQRGAVASEDSLRAQLEQQENATA